MPFFRHASARSKRTTWRMARRFKRLTILALMVLIQLTSPVRAVYSSVCFFSRTPNEGARWPEAARDLPLG